MNVPVKTLYLLLLCLIALTVVMLIKIVGVILVIALLSIPAAIAHQHSDDLKKIMLNAILFGIFFTFAGMWLSYLADVPSGATIIILTATTYGISIIFEKVRKKSVIVQ